MRHFVSAVAALGALAFGCGAEAQPKSVASGLYGVVTRGPITPVCTVGTPCDERAAAVLLSFRRAGQAPRSVRTDPRGRYRIRLVPGAYSVRTSVQPFGLVPQPSAVRVLPGRFRRVDLAIDTGIR